MSTRQGSADAVPPGPASGAALFDELVEHWVRLPGVDRSSMMGLSCLRYEGRFFSSWDGRSRSLVVKLPAERVADLVASGPGVPFAPAGRVFREWVAVPDPDRTAWTALLREAHEHVSGMTEQGDSSAPARVGVGGAAVVPTARTASGRGFAGFPEDAFAFLAELAADNSKGFVERNRARYRDGLLEPSKAFVEALVPEVSRRISTGLTGRAEVGGSLFRFAVDRRFAPDRPPYRTELDLILWEGDEPPRANPALLLRLTPDEVQLGAGVAGLSGARLDAYRAALRADPGGLAEVVDALLTDGGALSPPSRKRPPTGVGPSADAARFGVRDGFHVVRSYPRPAQTATAGLVDWCVDRLEAFGPLHRWFVAALGQGRL